MITVRIKYYNVLADFLGRRREERILATGSSMRDLIQCLAAENGSFRRLALTPEGEISRHLRLFRNGQAMLELDQPLAEDDEILMFPAISGG